MDTLSQPLLERDSPSCVTGARPSPRPRPGAPAAALVAASLALAACGGGDGTIGGPANERGSIRISVSTSGVDLDPDGYVAVLDGVFYEALEREGAQTIDVPAGRSTLGLGDVANNCSIRGQQSLSLNVQAGRTVKAGFELDCTELASLGEVIAFTREGANGRLGIYLMNPDGTDVRQLTDPSEADDSEPAISPDGKRIAFVRSREVPRPSGVGTSTDHDVWVMHADGDEQNKLVPGLNPTWSRNGQRLGFEGVPSGSVGIQGGGVWSVGAFAFGGVTTVVTERNPNQPCCNPPDDSFNADVELLRRDAFEPNWSPDGARFVYVDDDRIHVMNSDGGDPTTVTVSGDQFRQDASPVWSPDGARIAFASDRDRNWDIYVIGVDGTGEVRLTDDPAKDSRPAWSPDGNRVLFVTDRDGNEEIYAVNTDGSGMGNLTQYPAADLDPDGRR